jgi:CDP-diacylglycerol---glycerol-3-phosphate 3-phosphatidyltransferase
VKKHPPVTPNQLTIFRIVLALICPVLIIGYRSFWIDVTVSVAFTVASLTDYWDGYLARKYGLSTNFGKIADPIADKIMILGLMFAFVAQGLYSIEWVIPIAVREIAVTAIRIVRLRRGQVLPAEWAGKMKVGFQILSIAATLFFLMAFDSGLFYAPEPIVLFVFQTFHYVGILLALITTVASGVIFFYRLNSE